MTPALNPIKTSQLGKLSQYPNQYDNTLLHTIPRSILRNKRGITTSAVFKYGYDTWNAYEVSWLNSKGKPLVAIARIVFPMHSTHLVESKSLKLYLNSLNQTKIHSSDQVIQLIQNDISAAVGLPVQVTLHNVNAPRTQHTIHSSAILLDTLDIEVNEYNANPKLITTNNTMVSEETLYSHLLKSNCLVTKQPDWGSVFIEYSGHQINHEGLLKYIISLRHDNEFHEDCVEHIFMDIHQRCQPTSLTVYAKYTRRGGLDINPIRSTHPVRPLTQDCLARQ